MSKEKKISIDMQSKNLVIEIVSNEHNTDLDDIYVVAASYIMDFETDKTVSETKEYSVLIGIRDAITNYLIPAQEIETIAKININAIKDVLTIDIKSPPIFVLNVFKIALENFDHEKHSGRDKKFIESFTRAIESEIINYNN